MSKEGAFAIFSVQGYGSFLEQCIPKMCSECLKMFLMKEDIFGCYRNDPAPLPREDINNTPLPSPDILYKFKTSSGRLPSPPLWTAEISSMGGEWNFWNDPFSDLCQVSSDFEIATSNYQG